jgi:hypothetical protein
MRFLHRRAGHTQDDDAWFQLILPRKIGQHGTNDKICTGMETDTP